MPLKFDKKNKPKREHRERHVLAETDAPDSRGTRWWHLVSGELLSLGFAAVLCCFVPEKMQMPLCFFAVAYFAWIVLSNAAHSALWAGVSALVAVAAALVSPGGFYAGFLHFANQCITIFNGRFDTYVSALAAPPCTDFNAFQFELVLLAGLLWIVLAAVEAHHLWHATLICMGAFAAIGLGGLRVPPVLCGVLALGWVVNWVEKATGYGIGRRIVVFLVPLCLCLCGIVAVVSVRLTAVNAGASLLHRNAVQSVDTFRYGSDTLPRGEMALAAGMGVGNDSTLRVKFSASPQELYLRGFVGGNFDGSRWNPPEVKLYHGENNGIIAWLTESGLSMPFQLGTYYSLTERGAQSPRATVALTNTGAYRKYLYLPYQSLAVSGGHGRLNEDAQMISSGLFGAKKYEATTAGVLDFRQSVLRENVLTDLDNAQSFDSAEQVYRIFVHENYLTISDEERQTVNESIFGGDDWDGAGVSDVTARIRLMAQSVISVSAEPARWSGEPDYVTWLLSGGKMGNSASYATVAVLAYRCAGIPARYVEGYYLSAARAAAMAADKTVELTDADAHAWAEVYLDGVGWIPVETTPGFYQAEYMVSQVLGQPESAINIAADQGGQKLEGSTADTLPTVNTPAPTPEQVARSIHVVGALLFGAILLWMAHLALEMQAWLRCRARRRKIQRAKPEMAVRLMFRDMFCLFGMAGFSADERRPKEAAMRFGKAFPGMETAEYTRFVNLLEKTVFGQMTPTAEELVFAKRFMVRLERTVLEQATARRRMVMKYLHARSEERTA